MSEADQVSGKRISVIGAGISGSGLARLAARLGAKVFVSESKTLSDESIISSFRDAGIEWEDGGHSRRLYDADYILVGSGVSPNAAPVAEAGRMGLPVMGELDFLAPYLTGKTIGVTGSNGKSTTTALIGHLLQNAGFSVEVTGNIGKSMADSVLERRNFFVVELSSFQLYWNSLFACDVALVTNLAPDHIDWHGSFEEYVKAKGRILSTRKEEGYSVFQQQDRAALSSSFTDRCRNIITFQWRDGRDGIQWDGLYADSLEERVSLRLPGGEEEILFDFRDVPLMGRHNIENAAFAAAAVRLAAGPGVFHGGLFSGFRGLAHRCEFVATIADVTYVDDSKGTNVAASSTALRSLPGKKVVILGGQGKGEEYGPLAEAVRNEACAAVVLGEEKTKIADALLNAGFPDFFVVDSMEEAVRKASVVAPPRSIVLLSPACTSWDMYPNYKKRGEDFQRIVLELKEEE